MRKEKSLAARDESIFVSDERPSSSSESKHTPIEFPEDADGSLADSINVVLELAAVTQPGTFESPSS